MEHTNVLSSKSEKSLRETERMSTGPYTRGSDFFLFYYPSHYNCQNLEDTPFVEDTSSTMTPCLCVYRLFFFMCTNL